MPITFGLDLSRRRKEQQALDELDRQRQAQQEMISGMLPGIPQSTMAGGLDFGQRPTISPEQALALQTLQPGQASVQALEMLEQQRQLAQQQQAEEQFTGQFPGVAGLMPGLGIPALQKDISAAITKKVAPDEQKPTTLQQNLAAFGVDLKTKEGQKIGLDILSRPSVQINQSPDLPTNYMWDNPITKTGVVPIPGSPADPKIKTFADRSKKLNESTAKIGQVEQSVSGYRELLTKIGPTVLPGKEHTELRTAYTDLLLEMKELYNLGVLNGPDLEIMQNLIIDPTSPRAIALQSVSGPDALLSQIDLVERKIESARNRAKVIYGNDIPDPRTPLPATGGRPPLSSFEE